MINPIKINSKGKYKHKTIKKSTEFDPKSFRTKKISARKKLIIACPKGCWHKKKKKCMAGMKAQAELTLQPKFKNPMTTKISGATLIGKQVVAIEYKDIEKAKRLGLSHPERTWRHDFQTTTARMYGLPNGDILITGQKKLWEWRNY